MFKTGRKFGMTRRCFLWLSNLRGVSSVSIYRREKLTVVAFLIGGMVLLNARIKIALLVVLTLVALGTVAFAAITTVQAFHAVQQQHARARSGDVQAIRPWMTVHDIAHIYHVPENYLYHSLDIKDPTSYRRDDLTLLANRQHRPVDKIIRTVQASILMYRRDPPPPLASLTPSLSAQLIAEGVAA